MAMNANTADAGFSAQRRTSISVNVAISIAAAVLLVVFLNWFGALRQYRRDVSTFGGYGLSERTRNILTDVQGDVNVSVLYSPDESSKDPTRYIDRVMDYLDEVRRVNPAVKVEQVRGHNARAKLVGRLTGTLGGEADKHKAAIASFKNLSLELQQALEKQIEIGGKLQSMDQAWLNDFPLYASVVDQLRQNLERLKKTVATVEQSTAAAGVPKYGEAAERVKADLGLIKTDLNGAAKEFDQLTALADGLSKTDAEELQALTQVASTMPPLMDGLRKEIGEPNSPLPGDMKAVLKQFADDSQKADKAIQQAVKDVEKIAKKFPAIAEHSLWSIQAAIGGGMAVRLPLTRQLSEVGRSFSDLRLQILGIIDKGDAKTMERAVVRLRELIAQIDENFKTAARSLGDLAKRIGQVDPVSRTVLDEARGGNFMKQSLDGIAKLTKDMEALPELKLGSIADDIREDNVIVVEANNKVRVIKFDEVWPVKTMIADPQATAGEEQVRIFNGDGVISAALLALTRDKPFATVVFTYYQAKDDQRNMFMRPQPPPISLEDLTVLKKRLSESNFTVKDWDLAAGGEAPKPEPGTANVYVILPPAPPQPPNPFMQQQAPPKAFGDPERQKIAEALKGETRSVFLVTWDVRPGGPFGGGFMTPRYALDDYLKDNWGVTVESGYRVTWVVPDNRNPDKLSVDAERFQMMPLNSFTDQPIGKPFQTYPVRIFEAAPLKLADSPPAGVKLDPVLNVPPGEEYVGADVNSLVRIINEIANPANNGLVARSPTLLRSPFTLMVAGTNETTKAKSVVLAAGRSLADTFISRPMFKQVNGRLVSEPPPTTNVELMTNSVFWLLGQDKLIASGPPAAPSVKSIDPDKMTFLRVLTYGVWPALVFAPGIFIWYLRRR